MVEMTHYMRYVDDIFALIDCKESNTADEILHLMHYLEESVKFTLETVNMEMPFLVFRFINFLYIIFPGSYSCLKRSLFSTLLSLVRLRQK